MGHSFISRGSAKPVDDRYETLKNVIESEFFRRLPGKRFRRFLTERLVTLEISFLLLKFTVLPCVEKWSILIRSKSDFLAEWFQKQRRSGEGVPKPHAIHGARELLFFFDRSHISVRMVAGGWHQVRSIPPIFLRFPRITLRKVSFRPVQRPSLTLSIADDALLTNLIHPRRCPKQTGTEYGRLIQGEPWLLRAPHLFIRQPIRFRDLGAHWKGPH